MGENTYQLSYEVISNRAIRLESPSPIARRVLKNSDGLAAGRSAHFYALAPTIRSLSAAIEEAEFAWTWLDKWLEPAPVSNHRSLLAIVDDPKLWQSLVDRHGLRHDSLAMQIQQELYLKDDEGQAARPDRIAHEVVHLRLTSSGESPLPLWLEEGFANYAGWRCAVAINHARGITLYRNLPALDESRILPLSSLMALTAYPADPEDAKVFYRQSEEWVAALVEVRGPEVMRTLVEKARSFKIDQPDGLREALAMEKPELESLEQEVNRRCREPLKF
jgi:hypothetical protein